MHAIVVGKDEELLWEEQADPRLLNGYAIISVRAAGVNRADILQRKGHYPPPSGASEVLGLELAGEIIGISGESNWKPGQRVMALVPGGGYATKAAVPLGMLLPIPDQLSFVEAAAIPEALYTSFLNLVEVGKLQRNETVLIHAGAGGIGTTAIQLAKSLQAHVIATAGTETKLAFCLSLGADTAIDYHDSDFGQKLMDAARQRIDLIFDTVGGSQYASLHPKVLNKYGRWILIGLLGGHKAEIDLGQILTKNITLIGSTLRSRSEEVKEKLTRHIFNDMLPHYQNGQLKPVLDRIFPVSETAAAHEYMQLDKACGKVVLAIG